MEDTLIPASNLSSNSTRQNQSNTDASGLRTRTSYLWHGSHACKVPHKKHCRARSPCQSKRVTRHVTYASQSARSINALYCQNGVCPLITNLHTLLLRQSLNLLNIDSFWQLEGIPLTTRVAATMFGAYDRFKDESCLFGVHSSCVVVELCFKRVHIGKRRCCRLPRESNVSNE